MSRRGAVAIGLLAAALLGSVAGNVWLYGKAAGYYRQASETRLDPLGIATFGTPAAVPAFAASAASTTAAASAPVVVFLGDSRAADWTAPAALSGKASVVNRGIGGQTTAQVLGRFDAHVAPLAPAVVVLQVGINDLKAIPLFPDRRDAIVADCLGNIARLVAKSLAGGARVVLTTVMPTGALPIERMPYWSADVDRAVDEVNAGIAALAGPRVRVFNTRRLLAGAQGRIDPRYSRDFLHLNAAGYAVLNDAMAESLMP